MDENKMCQNQAPGARMCLLEEACLGFIMPTGVKHLLAMSHEETERILAQPVHGCSLR